MNVDIEKMLLEGKTIKISPRGTSMSPIIKEGRDEVVLQYQKPDNLKRGDVVLYRREGSILVLHRIHHKDANGFYMVGDNQTLIEGPIKQEQIRAKMIFLVRKNKMISANNPIYVVISRTWLFIRPLRPFVRKVGRVLKRLWRRK